MMKALILDFGGVIAEEGFKNGLYHIAQTHGINPESFFAACSELTYTTGFLVQEASEADYWNAVRRRTGIEADDADMKKIIMDRFIVRPDVLETVDIARKNGKKTAILSDQVSWLDELNERNGNFFEKFDVVYNSWHKGMTKREPQFFESLLMELRVDASRAVFVDDNAGHVSRALTLGMVTHHFTATDEYLVAIKKFIT